MIKKYKNTNEQVKASFWFLICAFFQRGMAVITTPIFTRLMSTEDYGVYGAFVSWQTIVCTIITLNLYSGIFLQGIIKTEKKKNEYTAIMMGLSTFLVIIWTLFYLVFNGFINELLSLNTEQIFLMISLIWSTSIYNFWASKQRVENRYKLLVIITVVVSLLQPFLGILFVNFAKNKVTARIAGMALVAVLSYAPIFFIFIIKAKSFYSWKIWKHMFILAIPLLPHYLSTTIMNCSDRIMIKNMIGSSEAGIYSLAYSISLIMTVFNQALLQTIEPWLYKKIKDGQIYKIKQIAYPSFLLIAVINIILIFFAPEVINLFAPEDYSDAIWVVPPVAMSVFFMFEYTFFAVFEFYYEKTKYIACATFIGAAMNILLNYFFIKWLGYYAAGYTTLICYIIFVVMHYCFMKKICKKFHSNESPYDGRIIIGLSVSFLIIGFLLMLTYYNIWIRFGIIFLTNIIIIVNRRKIIKMFKKIVLAKKGE